MWKTQRKKCSGAGAVRDLRTTPDYPEASPGVSQRLAGFRWRWSGMRRMGNKGVAVAAMQDEPMAGNRVTACLSPTTCIGTTTTTLSSVTDLSVIEDCSNCCCIMIALLISLIDCFGGCCQLDGAGRPFYHESSWYQTLPSLWAQLCSGNDETTAELWQ